MLTQGRPIFDAGQQVKEGAIGHRDRRDLAEMRKKRTDYGNIFLRMSLTVKKFLLDNTP